MRYRIILPLAGLAILLAGVASASWSRSDDRPIEASLIQIIANPKDFDGKLVRVQGFVRLEHEGTAVYLHREDWEHSLYRNGLWIEADEDPPKEGSVNNSYALIEGVFRASPKGHMGLWSGSIDKISRMEPRVFPRSR
jgi:hypothetical protein